MQWLSGNGEALFLDFSLDDDGWSSRQPKDAVSNTSEEGAIFCWSVFRSEDYHIDVVAVSILEDRFNRMAVLEHFFGFGIELFRT